MSKRIRLFQRGWNLALCAVCLLALSGCGGGQTSSVGGNAVKVAPKVYMEQKEGLFRIIRNGKPWQIKGAAGEGNHLDVLAAAGGNTLRLYWHEGAEAVLRKADSLGLAVIIDLPVPQIRSGFDYRNRQKVDSLTRNIVGIVNRLDSFPAMLMWCAGNEFDLQHTDALVPWQKLNQIVARIHEADPDHPVITATQAGTPLRYAKVLGLASEIDALGINLFKETANIQADWVAIPALERKPYLITEWAPIGTWQANQTAWEAPVEPNSQVKAEMYRIVYEDYILTDSVNCLGSCVFYWGQKQERTHTWYSLFSESGEKTSIVDALAKAWRGPELPNRAPDVQAISVRGFSTDSVLYLDAGKEYLAWMFHTDPDGDTLVRTWEIVPEGSYRQRFGGERELRPLPRNELLLESKQDWLNFKAPPTAGPYRLFGYVKDGKGGAASVNIPFFVVFPVPSEAK